MKKTEITPENLLVAVLHKIGTKTRLTDDARFAYLFNNASKDAPEIFGNFAWHPQYHDSKTLRNTLQNLDLGGAIVRENASIRNFRVAPRVAGQYGESIFESLPSEVKEAVSALSEQILSSFETSSQAI